jgi:hypothetical protein
MHEDRADLRAATRPACAVPSRIESIRAAAGLGIESQSVTGAGGHRRAKIFDLRGLIVV